MVKIRTSHLVSALVIFCGVLFFFHSFIISQTLSDGVHLNPASNTVPWQDDGVRITVTDNANNELMDDDIVIAVEDNPITLWMERLFCFPAYCDIPTPLLLEAGTRLNYTVLRSGNVQTVTATLRKYPFWEVLRRSWGSLTFALVNYVVFSVLLMRKPDDQSIIALAIASSGLFGSIAWLFGFQITDFLVGDTFWLYRFSTEVVYLLSAVGVLHFALVFPTPLPIVHNRGWLLVGIYVVTYGLYGYLVWNARQTTENPVQLMASVVDANTTVPTLCYGLSLLCIILNYRIIKEESQRQKIRIVFFTISLVLGLSLILRGLPWLVNSETLVTSNEMGIIGLIVPVAVVFAIQRHRLWNIDPIINRTLVYFSLSAVIVGLYIILVEITGNVLQTGLSLPSSILATGSVTIMFQPIRRGVQRTVDRVMYGQRDDPVIVFQRLAQQMESSTLPTNILPNLAQTIAQTLKIPYVSILLADDTGQMKTAATWGTPSTHTEAIALMYQNDVLGNLVVAQRGAQESFNQQELSLLSSIAAITATTVRAVQLSHDLRRSRQRIVTAREEERRRIRRNLHDGLGPQLASQTLGLEAISQLMLVNPEKAQALLEALKSQAQEAILDVRRLVYDLRPPALDDLGLVGALRQTANRYETELLRFSFEIANNLPDLPAAVETAIYRVAQEAMTNVVRHAHATVCNVHLYCEENQLVIDVRDNGQGLNSEAQSGVGLQSMLERAAELNGTCVIDPLPDGGTRVRAQFPLEVYND